MPVILIAAIAVAYTVRRVMPWRLGRRTTLLLTNLGTLALLGGGALFMFAAGACFDCGAVNVGYLIGMAGFLLMCVSVAFGARRTRDRDS